MRVLGMISGTSHDGVDAAVVEFEQQGTVLRGRLLRSRTTPYPPELRRRLIAALPPAAVPLAEVCALDTLLGQYFADRAAAAAAGLDVDLVCSHGQTVFHWVQDGRARGGLQLGQPAWIAESTGAAVLSDVRSRDIVAGGQGAPLVPILDLLLCGGGAGRSAALNLGGIANMTVIPGADDALTPYAYDLGPANALIDAAVFGITGGEQAYDADGMLGAVGRLDDALLTALLAEPYYALPAPKSTGKELFHDGYLDEFRAAHPGVEGADLVATLTALTAEVVARGVRAAALSTLVVSGGGAANPTLMRMIGKGLPGVEIVSSDAFGAPSDVKEAIAFALIGYLSAHGLPANVPSCTGASGPRVLGSFTPGRDGTPLRPALEMPTQLLMR